MIPRAHPTPPVAIVQLFRLLLVAALWLYLVGCAGIGDSGAPHPHAIVTDAPASLAPANPNWPSSGEKAAREMGWCSQLVYQQPYQAVSEAIRNLVPNTCLVLRADSPTPSDEVYFGYGGMYQDARILYLSDTPSIKIWDQNAMVTVRP